MNLICLTVEQVFQALLNLQAVEEIYHHILALEKVLESALNGIDKTYVASSLVGTALRAHRNRKENAVDADEEIK